MTVYESGYYIVYIRLNIYIMTDRGRDGLKQYMLRGQDSATKTFGQWQANNNFVASDLATNHTKNLRDGSQLSYPLLHRPLC